MNRSWIIFEHSPWFILLCIAGGIGYAWFLYRKPGPWPFNVRILMAVLRGLLVSAALFLLIGPIVKQISSSLEKPVLVFAVDNSSSIAEIEDSVFLQNLAGNLSGVTTPLNDDYQIEFRTLAAKGNELNNIGGLAFDQQTTNLYNMIRDIEADHEGKNLNSVVLISDGIYNEGLSPLYRNYNFDIHTVGLGDTTTKSDLSIRAVYYNKISYQGNKFPVVIEAINEGFVGRSTSLSISKEGKVIDSKSISFGGNNQLSEVQFLIDADDEGLQRYEINLSPLEGEYTLQNNQRQIFVDVVEGRENILIVAPFPHPDIKAIRSALETNKNYNVSQYIPGLNNFKEDKYDLVIFYQVPEKRRRTREIFNQLMDGDNAVFIIVGTSTDLAALRSSTSLVNFNAIRNQVDQVTAAANPGFTDFVLTDGLQEIIPNLPPVTVPFGRYNAMPDASVLLTQKVGSVKTNRPLLVIGSGSGEAQKQGILMGEGIWRWKLYEYMHSESHQKFNELVTKIVQYLSAQEDKRKFKVYTTEDQFTTDQRVEFITEIYNDLYEPIFGQNINLTITDQEGSSRQYTYVNSPAQTSYHVSELPEGIYRYTASTLLEGNQVTASGEFVVEERNIEMLNLTADHGFLRQLASSTGGSFFHTDELSDLARTLDGKDTAGIIHSYEQYLPLINLKWLFFVLLALISTEWFLRKYYGSY